MPVAYGLGRTPKAYQLIVREAEYSYSISSAAFAAKAGYLHMVAMPIFDTGA